MCEGSAVKLLSNDFKRSLHFVAQMVIKLDDDPTMFSNILWTNEARFHRNGQVNHHNQHYWSKINPNWAWESNVQTRWSSNVWCGLIDEYLVGPYFYEGNLNGKKYLHFLKNELPVLLEYLPLSKRKYLFWQQDGAPAHNYRQVQDYLNYTYGDNWMGTRRPEIQWPARSPDMTPLDFFWGGFVKNAVYEKMPSSKNELMNKIKEVCSNIPADIMKNVQL